MATIGIELCDTGIQTAALAGDLPRLLDVASEQGNSEWPGFCHHDGARYVFGRAAEDMWFVQPRRVAHNFWARLAHEPAAIHIGVKPPSYSELAFYFLREFTARLKVAAGAPGQVVLAIPGAYLKDEAVAEEKVGLLLGMAGELKLPVAGLVDMACAALCDPRTTGFNPALPVVVLDLHLEGADLTLLTADGRLERRDFIHLPQAGYARLLKLLTGTMGNRFLRHTAFDILEDGRIEQTFFRQTKGFLFGETAEHRYQINTDTRAYEMVVKREQLAADANAFVVSLVQDVQSFIRQSPHASEPCTIALTDRATHVPGLESRLRAAGMTRILRLPLGAAAGGAARLGAHGLKTPGNLADVPVLTSAPLTEVRQAVAAAWEARLQKLHQTGPRISPTHAILEGIGHALGHKRRFLIGSASQGPDLALPEFFTDADNCSLSIVHESGRLWFIDPALALNAPDPDAIASRVAIEAGDRLILRCGQATAEILFAHCPGSTGTSVTT